MSDPDETACQCMGNPDVRDAFSGILIVYRVNSGRVSSAKDTFCDENPTKKATNIKTLIILKLLPKTAIKRLTWLLRRLASRQVAMKIRL